MLDVLQLLADKNGLSPQPLNSHKGSVLQNIAALIFSEHLAAVNVWPMYAGGNLSGVASLTAKVASLLHVPFSNQNSTPHDRPEARQLQVCCAGSATATATLLPALRRCYLSYHTARPRSPAAGSSTPRSADPARGRTGLPDCPPPMPGAGPSSLDTLQRLANAPCRSAAIE